MAFFPAGEGGAGLVDGGAAGVEAVGVVDFFGKVLCGWVVSECVVCGLEGVGGIRFRCPRLSIQVLLLMPVSLRSLGLWWLDFICALHYLELVLGVKVPPK